MSFRSHLTVLALLLTNVGSAHAFSDPFSFNLTPIVAGGGGRFFTGSPSDGYTCKTCHVGGQAPKVSVLGLPLSGYKPGGRYEVSIRWPAEQTKISLALELTDGKGKAAGTLRLPPLEETQPGEFCEPASEQLLAAQLNDMNEGREIINLPECESKSLRFLWTAPMTDVGQVWFSGSMVQSDGEQDPYHDGVTDFGRIIGSPAVASTTNGECSVTRVGGASSNVAAFALLGLCGVLWLRSCKRRRV
jgi:MYXO-CTERM domain-containing protein